MIERFETRSQLTAFTAAAVLFAAVLLVSIASVGNRIGRPSPGFAVWSNLVVPALSTQSSAASARVPFRSVVTEVDGAPVRTAAELRGLLDARPVGQVHDYVFRRGERDLHDRLPSSLLRWRDVLPVFAPYLLVGSAFFVLVLLVFYFKPASAAARGALAAGSALGATLILAIDTVSSAWLERPYFLVESLVPGAFLHFSLCFPEEKEILRRHPWLEWLVYAPFLPLGVLENFALNRSPEWHLALNDWVYTSMAVTGLIMVGSLLHTWATSKSALARQRAKVVTAGLAVAAFVPSLGLLSVILLGAPLPINALSPLFLFFPLSVAYAIARHDLFEVDRYLRTGVVYGALSLLVFLGYAGLVLGAEQVIGAEERLPTGLVPLYLLLVLLVFQPARVRLQHVVDRLLYRQAYSYRGTVERTSHALASMLESNRVASTLLSTLTEVMAIEWGVLFVFGESPAEQRTYARPSTLEARASELFPPEDPTLASIARVRRLMTSYELAGSKGSRHPAGFDFRAARELGTTLLLSLHFEDKPVGVLLLGEKRSGAFYSDDDVALLQTLAHQSALALENARAYELLQRTRDELVQAERLAAVGQLSAAVAHGIRNPLAGIRAAAQVAREDLEESDTPLAESLDDILAETDRLEARVRSVLDLSRPFEPSLMPGDLNRLVRDFASSLRSRIPPSIELSLELATLPSTTFDAAHLIEALDVLATNAIQAMSGGGRLVIATRADGNGQPGSAATVAVDVADTGAGMNAAQIGRIFDLFFTTKSGGTGIGLSVARRFVEAQGGSLSVTSEPGVGSTFSVVLPQR